MALIRKLLNALNIENRKNTQSEYPFQSNPPQKEISTLNVYCNPPAANFIDLQQNSDKQISLSDEKSKQIINVSDSDIIKEYDCKEEKLSEAASINKEPDKVIENVSPHKSNRLIIDGLHTFFINVAREILEQNSINTIPLMREYNLTEDDLSQIICDMKEANIIDENNNVIMPLDDFEWFVDIYKPGLFKCKSAIFSKKQFVDIGERIFSDGVQSVYNILPADEILDYLNIMENLKVISYDDCENKYNILISKENFYDICKGVPNLSKDFCIDTFTHSTNTQENLPEQEPFKYVFPPISLLRSNKKAENKKEISVRSEKLNQTFLAFGVNADIVSVIQGPRFTRFEIQIGTGVRIRDVLKIKNDIKLSLEAANLHIEAPISGKTTIGIDVENEKPSIVTCKEIIESKDFREFPSILAVAIGKDVTGNIIIESIDAMCHLLIGGTTGSGKSVCINSIIMSLLYKADPNEVNLILIDTKAINLSIYNGIPHLLLPVVTNLQKAIAVLQWCISEMMNRYKNFSDFSTRTLSEYNKSIEKYSATDKSLQKLPNIVIIIDDFSDLMIWDNTTIEECICRLSQMGRACGIHLIISTQRPSTDVITGTIKANIPSRIAFNVFSAIDSRTILDTKGAEELSADGDMLFYPQGQRTPLRVQGAFVTDMEITDVIDFIKNPKSNCPKYYNTEYAENGLQSQTQYMDNTLDYYFEEAGKFVIEKEKASIGMLQRIFKIGFNRAARIMDQLEEFGVVGMEEGTKPRKVLMNMDEFEQYIENLPLSKKRP